MKSLTILCAIIGVSYSIGDPIIIRSNNKLFDTIGDTLDGKDVPARLDWRDKNAVLPVINQGQCGESIVINTVDSIASFKTIHSGKKLVKLSQQQVFDCSVVPRICPCQASLPPETPFHELLTENNGNVDTDASYPYTAKCDNACHYGSAGVGATLRAYAQNSIINETLLQTLLQFGPVVTEIHAIQSFIDYKWGIFDDKQCTAGIFNHTLLVVGYDTDCGDDYWIARNTWGTNWGEEGYIRIGRNKGNLCGIASKLSLPWDVL